MDLILKQPKTRLIAAAVAALITLAAALLPNTAQAKQTEPGKEIYVYSERKKTDTGETWEKWQYEGYVKTDRNSPHTQHSGSNSDEQVNEEETYEAGIRRGSKACEEVQRLDAYITELYETEKNIEATLRQFDAANFYDAGKTLDRDTEGKFVREKKLAEAKKNYAIFTELLRQLEETQSLLEDAQDKYQQAVEECSQNQPIDASTSEPQR